VRHSWRARYSPRELPSRKNAAVARTRLAPIGLTLAGVRDAQLCYALCQSLEQRGINSSPRRRPRRRFHRQARRRVSARTAWSRAMWGRSSELRCNRSRDETRFCSDAGSRSVRLRASSELHSSGKSGSPGQVSQQVERTTASSGGPASSGAPSVRGERVRTRPPKDVRGGARGVGGGGFASRQHSLAPNWAPFAPLQGPTLDRVRRVL